MTTIEQITWGKLAKGSSILILVTLVVNLTIYFIGDAIGAFDGVEVNGMKFNGLPVIFSTIMYLVIATLVFGILTIKFQVTLSRMRILAIITVLLTLGIPFTIPDVRLETVIFLDLMHIVAGLILIPGLTSKYFWMEK